MNANGQEAGLVDWSLLKRKGQGMERKDLGLTTPEKDARQLKSLG
jgi:hypothetical protein